MRTRARSTPTAGGTTGSGLRGCHAHTSVGQTVSHPHMIFIARPARPSTRMFNHHRAYPVASFCRSRIHNLRTRSVVFALTRSFTWLRFHALTHPFIRWPATRLAHSLTSPRPVSVDRSLARSRPAGCCNMSWGACGFNNNNISVYSSDTLDNNNWKVESYDALPRATRKVGQYWQVTASCHPPCHSQG